MTIQDVEHAPLWAPGAVGREYEDFLQHLEAAQPLLERQYGPHWLVVLLVDELDAAVDALRNDQFFQNLRNLLMLSRFHRHFRLVASGVNTMADLITSGSSPLNNLRNQYLGILTETQARQLIAAGFADGLDREAEILLFHRMGRHPYLLQGLLEYLWEDGGKIDEFAIRQAERTFLREHHDFHRWLDAFGEAEHAIYQLLAESPKGTLHIRDIRRGIDASHAFHLDDALTILSYHGVIDDRDPDEPKIAGVLFRDWYWHRTPEPSARRTLSLFYSYSHRDETLRNDLETHLALLRRQEIIASWHDRQISVGQEWEGQIDRHLEEADIILLLISSDFLASDYCYDIEMQRALARHEAADAVVIPVMIRPVDRTDAPFETLQALPTDARPVTTWDNQDEAWLNVAQGIRQAAERLRTF